MLLPPLSVAIFTADGSKLDRRRQQQSATVGAAAVQSILIAILFYVSDATEQEEPEGLQMTTRACMLLPMSHDVLNMPDNNLIVFQHVAEVQREPGLNRDLVANSGMKVGAITDLILWIRCHRAGGA